MSSDETSIPSADARGTVTQREGNRNLSKSLPKRFGFFDLAIESSGSQEAGHANRFRLAFEMTKSALQQAFLALQQQFRLQTIFGRH
ncbi:hypothetical protein [Mesorhizobium sp. WSM3860]|uniref:hypothetical protein n=1 Tax=Mesorhizobium sp. WSM3860 TaxID=2029403 RepID=UPI000BAFCA36|nr:hypothetical protein [Mesorhizobium sp. WSM3860]PBC05260.1 hypothetical protein CK220_04640 [Mesorhizobium sp. WSM3860]